MYCLINNSDSGGEKAEGCANYSNSLFLYCTVYGRTAGTAAEHKPTAKPPSFSLARCTILLTPFHWTSGQVWPDPSAFPSRHLLLLLSENLKFSVRDRLPHYLIAPPPRTHIGSALASTEYRPVPPLLARYFLTVATGLLSSVHITHFYFIQSYCINCAVPTTARTCM